jgi:hypothetical protein
LLALVATAARADRPLGPPARREIPSRNGAFVAVTDPAAETTTVYRTGPLGTRVREWAMVGWFRVAHLADDGQHLVIGYPGANLLPLDATPDTVVLHFVRRGEQLAEVTLGELLPMNRLDRTVSHLAWRGQEGFDEDGAFRVETVDGKTHRFDGTGRRLPSARPPAEGTARRLRWVEACLAELERIRPGMTRQQVDRLLHADGGVQDFRRVRYVHPSCPYFKVDVSFRVARSLRPPGRTVASANDPVVEVSRPYLARPIAD